eukprot:PhF_6_TR4085/c0_g1_i1/m.5566/K22074/NFU1, HIRIP5; NFU1 iron-sulfur cluster scaffold homolog, mitochondrial
MFSRSYLRALFLRIQETPNPMCVMFSVSAPHRFLPDFMSSIEVRRTGPPPRRPSLLAARVLQQCGRSVVGVMVGKDFITVERCTEEDFQRLTGRENKTDKEAEDDGEEILLTWEDLRANTSAVLMEYITSGEAARALDQYAPDDPISGKPPGDEVDMAIYELVESVVRPLIQRDGGDITIKSFDRETGVLVVNLHGACRKCHNRPNTLKASVERVLQHYIPEVSEVQDADE